MITYIWAVGIGFTVLTFAGKAGLVAGMAGLRSSWLVLLSLSYGALAFLCGVILKLFNPLDYFQFFQKFLSFGVLFHLLMAFGLLSWGIYSIKSFVNGKLNTASKAGFLLMIPCPICLSAMLLSTSVLIAVTGMDPLKTGGIMAVCFSVIIAAVTLLSRRLMKGGGKNDGPVLLGFIMMMVGLYFVTSIIVIPAYSQSKIIWETAQRIVTTHLPAKQLIVLLIALVGLASLGFFKEKRTLR